jgi:hypothetical protein
MTQSRMVRRLGEDTFAGSGAGAFGPSVRRGQPRPELGRTFPRPGGHLRQGRGRLCWGWVVPSLDVRYGHRSWVSESSGVSVSPPGRGGGWRGRHWRAVVTGRLRAGLGGGFGEVLGCPAGRRGCGRLLLVAALVMVGAGCAGSSAQEPGAVVPSPTVTARAATPSPAPRASSRVIPVPRPPARLHQTRVLPRAHSKVFRAEMTDLWVALVSGRPRPGVQAFFPLTAYQQVKAIADPAADWRSRLLADFRLDVAAAHHFLRQTRGRPRLVRVIVPTAQAAWIDPGVCDNSVGYWHVAGPRMVYRQDGRVRSIGIASLISWRGRWYVVHLGAVLRNTPAGVVDQPQDGPGTPGPPGGC